MTIHPDFITIVHHDDCTVTTHVPDVDGEACMLPRAEWEELQRRRMQAMAQHTPTCAGHSVAHYGLSAPAPVEQPDTRGRSYIVERFE